MKRSNTGQGKGVTNSASKTRPPKKIKGLHVGPGEKPTRASMKDKDQITFLAKISKVDGERQKMDVVTIDNAVLMTDIPISPGYQGPMGFMGIMPEAGAMIQLMKGAEGAIFPVAYQIPDTEAGPDYRLVERFPESVTDEQVEANRIVPLRVRKLRAGEGRMASAHGGEIFLDRGVEITDRSSNTFAMRSGDSAIMSTSQQNYLFTTGVWRSAGPIQRNSLQLKDEEAGIEAKEIRHSDGTRAVYVGGDYGYGNPVRNEYRVEVEDSCQLNKPLNDVNDTENIVGRKPKVIFTMANFVGNDTNDMGTYGKFLAPAFISGDRGDGRLGFEAIVPNAEGDTIGTRGIAHGFYQPGKSFSGFDKQGVKYEYMSEARSKNTGLSQITVARGGRREEWGADLEDNVSWDMFAKGGIRWVVGKMATNPQRNKLPRSSEIRYIGGTYTEHGFDQENSPKIVNYVQGDNKGTPMSAADLATLRRVERVAGSSRDEVSNHREDIIGGSLTEKTSGSKNVSVSGASGESIGGDKTISAMGSISLNSSASMQVVAPKRTEKFTDGSDELNILKGDKVLDIVKGSVKTTVGTGDITTNIVSGDIKEKIASGSRKMEIGTGDYEVKVGAGSIDIKAGGGVTVSGTSMEIKAAKTTIDSAMVDIGNSATLSGVVTSLSHKDYTTGAPLITSLTVKAGM